MGESPSTESAPEVGERIPVIILMVVDFPAPLGPIKASRWPCSTCRSMPRTACTSRYSGLTSARKAARSPGCFTRVR